MGILLVVTDLFGEDEQTDGRDEADSRFWQLCEPHKKCILNNLAGGGVGACTGLL